MLNGLASVPWELGFQVFPCSFAAANRSGELGTGRARGLFVDRVRAAAIWLPGKKADKKSRRRKRASGVEIGRREEWYSSARWAALSA